MVIAARVLFWFRNQGVCSPGWPKIGPGHGDFGGGVSVFSIRFRPGGEEVDTSPLG